MVVLNWEILNQLPNIRDGVPGTGWEKGSPKGITNQASGSATSKGTGTIFRHEDKTHTKIWPTPTHKTSRKEQWYAN